MKKYAFFDKLDREKDVISINKFVSNYLMSGEETIDTKLSHNDLKKYKTPFILTVSYDFVDENIDLVKIGMILLVKDCFNKIIPYINPMELNKINELENIDNAIKELKKVRIYQFQLILSRWLELELLISQRNQIESTIKLLQYLNKEEKINDIRKEMIFNDKYKGKSRIKHLEP